MAMYKVSYLAIHIGIQVEGLSDEALSHERNPLFKTKLVDDIYARLGGATQIGNWSPFGTPSVLPIAAGTGVVDDADVQSLLAAQLLAAQGGNPTTAPISTGPDATFKSCEATPTGWKRHRSFSLRFGAASWTTIEATDAYSSGVLMDPNPRAELSGLVYHAQVTWDVSKV